MGKNDDSEERIAHTQPGSSQGLSPVCSVPGAQREQGSGRRVPLNPGTCRVGCVLSALETGSSTRTGWKAPGCRMSSGRGEPD